MAAKWKTKFILIILLLLAVSALYLFIRARAVLQRADDVALPKVEGQAPLVYDTSNWRVYEDSTYGYSVKYPPLLVLGKSEGGPYLSFVAFLASSGSVVRGYAISVRENDLQEEVTLIKEEIQKETFGRLTQEENINRNGSSGTRLDYEPENREGLEPRSIVILSNGQYSYTISAHPDDIGAILSTFMFLDSSILE